MARKAGRIDLGFLSSGASPAADLTATFQAASGAGLAQAESIALDRLLDNPYQPRGSIDESSVAELASVIKAQGFQGVLVARPDTERAGYYQLTAGHRRREAAKRAGLTTLPVVVRELSAEEMVILAITENIQREDLTTLEEGRIFLLMVGELGYTHEQVAQEVGKSRGYVENRIRVARAPQDVQQMVATRPDTIRAAASLVKVKDAERRAGAIAELLGGRLTADDLAGYLADGRESTPVPLTSDEKRPRPRRRAAATSSDAQTQGRVGAAKLDTALRSLLAYKATRIAGGEITRAERDKLTQVANLVRQLLTLPRGTTR